MTTNELTFDMPYRLADDLVEIRRITTDGSIGAGVWSLRQDDWVFGGRGMNLKSLRACQHWLANELGLDPTGTVECPDCGDAAASRMVKGWKPYQEEAYLVTCRGCGYEERETVDERDPIDEGWVFDSLGPPRESLEAAWVADQEPDTDDPPLLDLKDDRTAQRLVRQARAGDQDALEAIALASERLVKSQANDCRGAGGTPENRRRRVCMRKAEQRVRAREGSRASAGRAPRA